MNLLTKKSWVLKGTKMSPKIYVFWYLGTVGFNSSHGCIKCTVCGVYDRGGRHMSFPQINCPLRTDRNFREKWDDDHHKEDSPLLQLPIDMVDQIIIADFLHFLHLGLLLT